MQCSHLNAHCAEGSSPLHLKDYRYLPMVHAETFTLRRGSWPGPKLEWEQAQAVLQEQQGKGCSVRPLGSWAV